MRHGSGRCSGFVAPKPEIRLDVNLPKGYEARLGVFCTVVATLGLEMPSWNVQLLRLTLFVSAPVDGSGLWQAVVGTEPDVDERRPREGVRRQAGQVGDASLEMIIAANRLDWIMSAVGQLPIQDPGYHLGDPGTALEAFDKLLVPWLAGADLPVIRIAFGLIAVLPTPDRPASYVRLQELVPSVKYDADRTREVIYQVNRPTPSGSVVGVELNRITTWSALRFGMGNVGSSGGSLIITNIGDPRFFARCECDNNTPAERTEIFAPGQPETIYRELRDLAMLNLERGELG
jgi:hypothetical protein